MVVLLPVNDQAHVIRLELQLVQIVIQLPYRTLAADAVRRPSNSADVRLDLPCLFVRVRQSVQLVDPPQDLAVGQRDDLVVAPRLVHGHRQIPAVLPQSRAVNFIDKLLAR